jgi:hypothetical protein
MILPSFPLRCLGALAALSLLLPQTSPASPAKGVDVLTYRYNLTGDGVNAAETELDLDNVNPWDFGLQFAVPVAGQIYGQPLVKTNAGKGRKTLAIVATQLNVVTAVDLETGKPEWTIVLNDFGSPVPSDDVGSGDVVPAIGICSTPVISGNQLYVLSKAKSPTGPASADYAATIYKIDVGTGQILGKNRFAVTGYRFDNGAYTYRTGTPTEDPYVVGIGDGQVIVNGQSRVYFNALRQMNRVALSLVNGTVYAGFASHGDNGPYHGWVIGFDAQSLAVNAVFNSTPNGGLGGVWQSGGRIASDAKGSLYLETGNGTFSGNLLNKKGFPMDANYGDCFLKLRRDKSTASKQNPNGWGLAVVDYFTPKNNADINGADLDLGSCAPVVIPTKATTYLLGTGKDGTFYLMDAANMGKFNPGQDACLQEIPRALCVQGSDDLWTAFSTMTVFNNRIYGAGSGDYIKQFTLENGLIGGWFTDDGNRVQTDVRSKGDLLQWPGSNTSLSANGTKSAILWSIDRGANLLHAYRATDLLEIWNSGMSPSDALGNLIKFSVPTVANGHVLVGADGILYIYGLAPAQRH